MYVIFHTLEIGNVNVKCKYTPILLYCYSCDAPDDFPDPCVLYDNKIYSDSVEYELKLESDMAFCESDIRIWECKREV